MIKVSEKLRAEFAEMDAEERADNERQYGDWLKGKDIETFGASDTWMRVNARAGTFSREVRDLSTSTAGAGGNTVGQGLIDQLAQRLQIRNPFWKWGRVVETGSSIGQTTLPTIDDTANSSDIKAENTARETATDFTVGQKTFDVYKVDSGLLACSNELLQDSTLFNASVGAMLAARVDKRVAELLTIGDGSTQPQGVTVGAGNSSLTGFTVSPTLDNLLDLKYSIDAEWHESPNFCFLMHPTIIKGFKKALGAEGAAFFRPKSAAGEFDMLDGTPIVPCRYMPVAADEKGVICGDMNEFCIVIRREIFIQRLRERYAESYRTAFGATIRVDSNVLNASAIKYAVL